MKPKVTSEAKVELYFVRSTQHEDHYLHPDGEGAYKLTKGKKGAACWTLIRGANLLRELAQYDGQLELERIPRN